MNTTTRYSHRFLTRLLTLWVCFLPFTVQAQEKISVMVNPVQQVLPPQAGRYISDPGRYFNVWLVNNTDEVLQVHLGLQILQRFPNADELWVSTNMENGHIPQRPITLAPNQQKQLNPIEMRHLFDHFTKDDVFIREGRYFSVTDGDYGLLPEGEYETFLTAYEWNPELTTKVVLSDPNGGNALFNICYEADAPQFISPVITMNDGGFGELQVANMDKNLPVTFTWIPPTLNCNTSLVNFEYAVRIVEMGAMAPDEAMEVTTPTFYHKEHLRTPTFTLSQAYTRQMIENGQKAGKVYLLQVTASTPYAGSNSVNFSLIKNDGKSPILPFRLVDTTDSQDQTGQPQNSDGDGGGNDEDDKEEFKGDKDDKDDNDDKDDGPLYTFEQPLLVGPAFAGKTIRQVYVEEDIPVEWRRAWFAGGRGEMSDTIHFDYNVRLYKGNSVDSKETIFSYAPIDSINTTSLKDTIRWEKIKDKVTVGDYLMVRVTATPSTPNDGIKMQGDSINYRDFAVSQHFGETFECGHSTADVANKTVITEKPARNATLHIGAWELTFDDNYDSSVKLDEGVLKGTGWIHWPVAGLEGRIAVEFEDLKVNAEGIVFDGTCRTRANPTTQDGNVTIDGKSYSSQEIAQNLFSQDALNDIFGAVGLPAELQEKVRNEGANLAQSYNIGKYYSAYKTAQNLWTSGTLADLYFPLELPQSIKSKLPKDFDVQIADMTFSPTAAIMNVIAEIVMPNSDVFNHQQVLVFGAPRLCVQPDRILPEDGVISLLSNFPIKDPSSEFVFTFKAPSDPLDPGSHDGCFIRWKDDKFDALGLGFTMTLPNTKRIIGGQVRDDVPALLDLYATIEKDSSAVNFLAEGFLTAFEVNDLPGWKFGTDAGDEGVRVIFDHNTGRNGDHMPSISKMDELYPNKAFDPQLCGNGVSSSAEGWNRWMGVYINGLSVEFPKFAVFGKGDEGLKIGADYMLIDASGITCKAFGKNIINAETGSCGGWAFSVDNATVDIVQNNFDNCKIDGSFGVPLLGKAAQKKAAAETKKTKNIDSSDDDTSGKGDYKDIDYRCEIRHFTAMEDVSVEKWNAAGTQKETATRRGYKNNRLAYVFSTTNKNNVDLTLNFVLGDMSLDAEQTYFLVESVDDDPDEEGDQAYTQVELCMAGDITIARASKIDEGIVGLKSRLGKLGELIANTKLPIHMPGIHFAKMRLSNKKETEWRKDLGLDKDNLHEKRLKAQEDWLKDNWNYTFASGEEVALSENECYFNYGEWSLASEAKKIGPFTFNLKEFHPSMSSNGKFSLDIDGSIGFVGEKDNMISAGGGFSISGVLHKEGGIKNIKDWYISDGDLDFRRFELKCDFSVLRLVGDFEFGQNKDNENEKGFCCNELTVDIEGLFTLSCAGGYYNHKASNLTSEEKEKLKADDPDLMNTGNSDIKDVNYSWGYFTVNVESSMGLRVDPVVINRISGGFYFNCKPQVAEGASKESQNKFGKPKGQYGTIGIAFGLGMSTTAGEKALKADADMLVVYDRENHCLSAFKFYGGVEAVGGLIKADVNLLYVNDKNSAGQTLDRYLSLNITVDGGFESTELKELVGKANEKLESIKGEFDKFSSEVSDIVDTSMKNPMQGLKRLSGKGEEVPEDDKLTPDQTADEVTVEKGDDQKRNDLGLTAMRTQVQLELLVTWVKNTKPYNTPKWHLYLGQPNIDKRCSFTFIDFDAKICSARIGADAYLCLGNELPDNGQLPEIPKTIKEFLAGHESNTTDMGGDMAKAQNSRMNAVKSMLNPNNINGGVMVGASAWGNLKIDLGLLYGKLEAIAGFDAALVNYGNSAFCVNNHSRMGYNGWYATGQLYAYLAAELGMHINLGRLYNGNIVFFNAGIGGVLEMGLPHPTWVEGKARVKISLLNGLWKIDRKFQFSAGDHCVPFRGNALDGFSLFTGVNLGSDSLYQALCKPEFAVSKADVSRMIVTTNASLGSHHRLVDPSIADMADKYYEEDNDSIRNLLELQAARTYVFDMEKEATVYGNLGVRLVDLGTGPTDWLKKNPNLSESEFLRLCGRVSNYSGKGSSPFPTMLSLVASHYNKRENTVFEGSRRMSSYNKKTATPGEIIGQNNVSAMSWLLSPPTEKGKIMGTSYFCDGTNTFSKAIQDEKTIIEKNVNFRENKGQTFHLSDMNVQKGHSYALILSGDAYEIMNGEKSWCHYVDTTTMKEIPMKWKQEKVWFFRVKDDAEDRVNADELTTLEPYAALAYPSVDGTKVQNKSNEPFTAYFGDIMQPTIALNRDLSKDLSKDKMTWILTAYDASEFASKDSAQCWKEVQTRLAEYQTGDNCVNLHPANAFERIKKFGQAIGTAESQGRFYDYSKELYHLQLAYYKDGKQNTAPDDVRYLVDLWMTTAPHGVTVSGMDKTQDDSWLYSTNREITGNLLPYVVPFVGASPQQEPTFDYSDNLYNLTDDNIVLHNAKYKTVPYRLIDPWLYFAYLSKWTFIGDHTLNAYDFDHIPTPFASESLIYDFNGTIINSDFIKGTAAKSLWRLRNDMYRTWNTWSWNDSNQPKWPLPSTTKTVGGITAANQNGRASTVAPRVLGITQNDRTFTFAELFKDFMAPYDVAYRMSIHLRDWARNIWEEKLLNSWTGTNFIDDNLNIEMKQWNNLHRGQYINVSERGVTVRVPCYQLPLILGGAIGDDNKAKYLGVTLNSKNRGFKASVSNRQSSDQRFKTDVSNILFFRLIGNELTDWWSDDFAPRVFVRSSESAYAGSYLDNGEHPKVKLDLFDRNSALEEVSKFYGCAYRVDTYDLETGFYSVGNRASQPWQERFQIGYSSSDPNNLGEVDDIIRGTETTMAERMDRMVPWAIYTGGDKTLTLLYSDKNYSYDENYNNQEIINVFSGDNVLDHKWVSNKNIQKDIEHVVIDKSFGAVELTDLKFWFSGCENLKTIVGLQNLNTSNVESMAYMFYNCKKLEEIDLSSMNTNRLTSMANMFNGCEKLRNVNFTRFKTDAVTGIGAMFKNCSSLTSLDLSSFSGENVASCPQMFYGCSKLTTLDISNFDADEKVGKYSSSYNEMFVSVPNTLVSYIDVNLKEEIKDQIPGRKNVDNTAMKAVVAKNQDKEHVLIFLNARDAKLKKGYSGNIETPFEVYRDLTVESIYEGDNVMNTGNTVPGWAGDKKLVKVIFDQSFKSSFTSMYGWFQDCENLTTIECKRKLRTNHVKTMSHLFDGCINLESVNFIARHNTNEVEDMSYMFKDCKKLEEINLLYYGLDDFSCFNTGNVTYMSYMFQNCENLKKIILGENFNLGKVKSMQYMFSGCKNLIYIERERGLRDLDQADQLTNTAYMFGGCESLKDLMYFETFIKLLNTSNVTNMSYMFKDCKSMEEIDLSRFSTEKLTNTSYMFQGCSGLRKLDMSIFMASRATTFDGMFSGVPTNSYIYLPYNTNSKIHPTQVSKQTHPNLVLIYPTSVLLLRQNATSYAELVCLNTDTKYTKGEKYNGMEILDVWSGTDIYGGNGTWINAAPWAGHDEVSNVVKVTFTPGFQNVRPHNLRQWFAGMGKLKTIEGMEYLNTSDATEMDGMFRGCKSLKTLDLSHFDTSKVKSMQGMFSECSSLENLDLSHFNTKQVEDMSTMFYGCKRLKHVDLSSFDTKNVTSFYRMFFECSSLNDLDLSQFDVDNASLVGMFNNCSSLTSLDLSSFRTSQNILSTMFRNCISLRSLTIGNWFNANKLSEETFENVYKLKVYVPDYKLEQIREDFTTNLGFVEGVTGKFLVIGEEEVVENIAQVVWTESNSTLTFCYMPEFQVGETLGGAKVTEVWSGEDVTNSPRYGRPKWGNKNPKRVVIDPSFKEVKPKSMTYWFVPNKVVDNYIDELINLEYINTSEVVSMNHTFWGVSQKSVLIDFTKLDISNVKDITGMLPNNLKNESVLDLSTLDTRNVEYADSLFGYYIDSHVKVGPNFTFDNLKRKAVNSFSELVSMRDLFVEVVGSTPGSAATAAELTKVKNAFVDKLGWKATYGRIKATTEEVIQAVWTEGNKTLHFLVAPLYEAGEEALDYQMVTKVWSGDAVTNKKDGSSAAWSGISTLVEKVYFHNSFESVTPNSTSYWFSGFYNLKSIIGIKYLNTSKVKSMVNMFKKCQSLTSIDLKYFTTSQVEDMQSMFEGCKSLSGTLDVTPLSFTSATKMKNMFNSCSSLKCIKIWMPGYSVEVDLTGMFDGCEQLDSIYKGSSYWNADNQWANVTSTAYMFRNCKNLKSFPTNKISAQKMKTMESMFQNCTSLTFGDSGVLTIMSPSVLQNVAHMFEGCTKLSKLDLSSWSSVENLSSASYMFYGCSNLRTLKLITRFFSSGNIVAKNAFTQVKNCSVTIYEPRYASQNYVIYNTAKDRIINLFGFKEGTNGNLINGGQK